MSDDTNYRIQPAEDPEDKIAEPPGAQKQRIPVVTAFTVVLDQEGHWQALVATDQIELITARPATVWDIIPACAAVDADMRAQLASQATIKNQMEIANQAAKQAQGQAILRQIQDHRGNPLHR